MRKYKIQGDLKVSIHSDCVFLFSNEMKPPVPGSNPGTGFLDM